MFNSRITGEKLHFLWLWEKSALQRKAASKSHQKKHSGWFNWVCLPTLLKYFKFYKYIFPYGKNCLIIRGHQPILGEHSLKTEAIKKSLWKQYLSIKYEHWSAHVVSFRRHSAYLKKKSTLQIMKWHRGKMNWNLTHLKTLNPHLHGIFKCMQMQKLRFKGVCFGFLVALLNYLNLIFLFFFFFSKYQFIFMIYSAQAWFYGTFIVISPLLHGQEHHDSAKYFLLFSTDEKIPDLDSIRESKQWHNC